MFSSDHNVDELVTFAKSIGLKESWLQNEQGVHRVPHFDLTETKWRLALRKGAIPLSDIDSVKIWRDYERNQADKGFAMISKFFEDGRTDYLSWLQSLPPGERLQVGMALRRTAMDAALMVDGLVKEINENMVPYMRELLDATKQL